VRSLILDWGIPPMRPCAIAVGNRFWQEQAADALASPQLLAVKSLTLFRARDRRLRKLEGEISRMIAASL